MRDIRISAYSHVEQDFPNCTAIEDVGVKLTETSAGHASIVRDNGQIRDIGTITDSVDQSVGDTGETETTDQDGGRALHVLDRISSRAGALVNGTLSS